MVAKMRQRLDLDDLDDALLLPAVSNLGPGHAEA